MKPAALLLLACAAAHGACLIGGTVLDAETARPLPRVRVFARPADSHHKPSILRLTNAQGAFCFDRLAPDAYQLVAERAGYLRAVYGARPGHTDGIPLRVEEPRELPPVTLKMIGGAVLAGTVVDDRGQPVDGAQVELAQKIWDRTWTDSHVSSTHTDSNGAFRFSKLTPGNYYLSAAPPTPERNGMSGVLLDAKGQPLHPATMGTYYAGSLTFARATPIPLKAGQETGNLVLALNPAVTRRLTGRVTLPSGSAPAAELTLDLHPAGGGDYLDGNFGADIGKDGTFTAADLPPIEFEARVEGLGSPLSAKVDLTHGDVDGLVIEAPRTVDLRLTTRVEGPGAPAVAAPELTVCNVEKGAIASEMPDSSGVYQFHGLPPGLYRFTSEGQEVYVKRVVVNGRPLNDGLIDLRQAPPERLELVLSANLASLEGTLDRPKAGTPALSVTVVAVDETRNGPEVTSQSAVADHAGRFRFPSLVPAKYRLMAIEGFDEGPWGSFELVAALREKSAPVELREGDKKKIALPVISIEEWEAALRKVGM